jgi:hypothetical protein
MDFLPQTLIVERLLITIDKILPTLLENDDKKLLLNALEDFKSAIIPSAIHIKEVQDQTSKQNIIVTSQQAYSILQNAAFDIDLNYTSQAVEYHVDQFIMNLNNYGN